MIQYNRVTDEVEWQPSRGDYGAMCGTDLIRIIERHNCVHGCTRTGGPDAEREYGPGGTCHILALVALGDQPVPGLEPRPAGPHCAARQAPPEPAPAAAPTRRRVGPNALPCDVCGTGVLKSHVERTGEQRHGHHPASA